MNDDQLITAIRFLIEEARKSSDKPRTITISVETAERLLGLIHQPIKPTASGHLFTSDKYGAPCTRCGAQGRGVLKPCVRVTDLNWHLEKDELDP